MIVGRLLGRRLGLFFLGLVGRHPAAVAINVAEGGPGLVMVGVEEHGRGELDRRLGGETGLLAPGPRSSKRLLGQAAEAFRCGP